MHKTINGSTLRKMILSGAKSLEQNKDYIDSLNVFPVPDGDTGTNMSLTMLTAAKEISACASNNMSALCAALSKGALRGARGNSGVILSQIFKGICNVLSESGENVGCKQFAKALKEGSDIAYKAVTKPKEGTILTVIREMSDAALKICKKSIDIDEFLEKVIAEGEVSLKKTPELLPVLAKAGVVDAGGRGLLVIMQGFVNAIIGIEDYTFEFATDTFAADPSERSHVDYSNLAEIEFAYCTEFFIINLHKKTTEAEIDRFRESLMTIGDCVLVIGDLSMVKIHVHTNEPGTALNLAVKLGEVDRIKIENMLEENRALIGKGNENLKPFGIVSVCAGEGLAAIFKDLQVDAVIEGGQTMNPSAEDIANACDRVLASDIFVFPNNKNIILAAEQAKAISRRNLHIIPSKNVPQGLAGVLSYDAEAEAGENYEAMSDAIQNVKAGMVTYAVRNTKIGNFDLKEGDIIGIIEDGKSRIAAKGKDISKVVRDLVGKMMENDTSTITLYFGSEVTEEEAEKLATELQEKYDNCDVDFHFGGQPLYYYIIAME
ncbi:MAG: DAK2 domain-containing protein [Firmicutes bacterium]|nr:DAK2 domain-containing protein [Bacillota bacterium]